MKYFFSVALLALAACSTFDSRPAGPVQLQDGVSFAGWEGDTNKTWRVENGAFVGGSLQQMVPRNEFLASHRQFTNFILRMKVKLVGTEGFVNGGIQIRSQRITDPPNEMRGYQADVGAGWWGSLYDESRRNKILAKADPAVIDRVLKPGDWNDYEIRAEGKRVQLFINGAQTVDYTEPDDSLPQFGRLGVQVHGGGKTEAWYKDITIEELP
jgi:hypothetical protein